MKVAAIQHDIVWEDSAATHEIVTPLITSAVSSGARLIALTEMYATGFSMAVDKITEHPGGPNETFLIDQAQEHNVWICGSIAQFHPETLRPRNTCLLVNPQGIVYRYDKIHPFGYGKESEYYEAGSQTLTVDVEGLRVSLFICYDLRFSDAFWKLANKTDCYIVVANWPAARRNHWRALLTARAIENQAYVVGANRVGVGGSEEYVGDSCIIDPLGSTLATAAHIPTVLIADIDPQRVTEIRREYPFLADRR